MSPRTEEQFQEIRDQKKTLIMEVALDLFAHNGYFNTSISKIANEAGISKGLMYNYFTSKEDLLNQIILDGSMKMMEYFDPDHDGILTDDEFVYYIKQIFKLMNEKSTFWKLFYALTMQPDVFSLVDPRINHISDKMNSILYKFFESKGYENPQLEVLLFAVTMKGIGLSIVSAPDIFPAEMLIDGFINRYIKQPKQ